eukprot:10172729-Alexandrium_andersonii.AAC.1
MPQRASGKAISAHAAAEGAPWAARRSLRPLPQAPCHAAATLKKTQCDVGSLHEEQKLHKLRWACCCAFGDGLGS